MRFGDEDTTSGGVRQRRFDLDVDGRVVPGLLWTPADAGPGPRPLVAIGHGASHHKRQSYVVSLARRLVRHHQMGACAIDGPVHGDRQPDGGSQPALTFLRFAQVWSSDPTMTDAMVADWRATLDALGALPELAGGPVGYWGLSMGTILGLPLVAAEPRVDAAVLGLMGLTGPTRDRIDAAAAGLRCPVLFLVQWDDTLFDRTSALELFDRLAPSDKRLHAHPGGHGQVPDEGFTASVDFLATRLAG